LKLGTSPDDSPFVPLASSAAASAGCIQKGGRFNGDEAVRARRVSQTKGPIRPSSRIDSTIRKPTTSFQLSHGEFNLLNRPTLRGR
jgi:hypothetical protein